MKKRDASMHLSRIEAFAAIDRAHLDRLMASRLFEDQGWAGHLLPLIKLIQPCRLSST
jgi:hypothetical protein